MKSSRLYQDTRGAVMMTGLFMSTFLIGSMWFIIGMGDATIFRDKMQEAADHGAFTSTALHAKGMNFIVVCNLVMLLGTVIHVILGIISDIKFAKALACLKYKLPPIIIGCLLIRVPQWWSAYDRWDDYFDKMKPAFKGIHIAQKVASYAYPALGVIKAYDVGASYGGDSRTGPVRVFALSTSLIPGGGVNGSTSPSRTGTYTGSLPTRDPRSWKGSGLDNFSIIQSSPINNGNNGAGKEGLPVQAKSFDELCVKLVTVSGNALLSAAGANGVGGKAGGILAKLIGMGIRFRYCNSIHLHFPPLGPGFDRFWGEDGPYVVYKPAKNGNMWFQTWALNTNATRIDKNKNEDRVGIAQSKPGLYAPRSTQKDDTGKFYVAQSEFYFDCDDKWDTPMCNAQDNATFAIKWRARLVRVDIGTILSGVVGGALAGLTNMGAYQNFRANGLSNIVSRFATGFISQTILNNVLDEVVGQIEDYIQGALTPGRTPTIPGIYH